jgi:hypothetical protein
MPEQKITPLKSSRTGCYYFPDSDHYTQRDLATWLPELRRMGMGWLVLQAPAGRAIPEYFITGLLAAGIQPVIQFGLTMKDPLPDGIEMLCQSYAGWGVRYISFYDRPNLRQSWPAAAWTTTELVERFLDRFLLLAQVAVLSGMTPLFPTLEPGGDYWDLAFLQQGLAGVQRRAPALARSLALSACANMEQPLSWGAGGLERWPASRPYHTPAGSQDHRGFRIFEWYGATAQSKLGFCPPIFLFAPPAATSPTSHTDARRMAAARLLSGLSAEEDNIPQEPVSTPVAAGFLWLISTSPRSPQASAALFPPQQAPHPSAGALAELAELAGLASPADRHAKQGPTASQTASAAARTNGALRPIPHYLLLPIYEWGLDETGLARLIPFIRQHRPTIGFSLTEARLAQRVSVVGGAQAYPEEVLSFLVDAGCHVERLLQDGTIIA